jgi:hypothetical protein
VFVSSPRRHGAAPVRAEGADLDAVLREIVRTIGTMEVPGVLGDLVLIADRGRREGIGPGIGIGRSEQSNFTSTNADFSGLRIAVDPRSGRIVVRVEVVDRRLIVLEELVVLGEERNLTIRTVADIADAVLVAITLGGIPVVGTVVEMILDSVDVVVTALVGLSVAVVVDIVEANLRGNRAAGTTRILDTIVDGAIAVIVDVVADLDRHRTALATGVQDAIVDHAIAIVVLTVADFLGHGATGIARVLDAFVDAAVAVVVHGIADFGRDSATCAAGIEYAVIDLPVAVVVDAIAHLGRNGATLIAGVFHAFVDGSVTVVVDVVTDFHGHGAALTTRIEQTFVHRLIAVIVEAVTDLFSDRTAATAGVQDAFVDATVAVVVEIIANLSRNGATDTARVQDAVVHGSVAVVVETVADLDARHDRDDRTGSNASAADDGSRTSALALLTIVARHAKAEAFVDRAIAVVVDSVADFTRRESALPTGVAKTHEVRAVVTLIALAIAVGVDTIVDDVRTQVIDVEDAVAVGVIGITDWGRRRCVNAEMVDTYEGDVAAIEVDVALDRLAVGAFVDHDALSVGADFALSTVGVVDTGRGLIVIAHVADEVAVRVVLVFIREERTVVEYIRNTVTVAIRRRKRNTVDEVFVDHAVAVVVDAVAQVIGVGVNVDVVVATVHVAAEAVTITVERLTTTVLDRHVVARGEVRHVVVVTVTVTGITEVITVEIETERIPGAGAIVIHVENAVCVVVGIASIAEGVTVAITAVEVGLIEIGHHPTVVHDVDDVVSIVVGITGITETIAIRVDLIGIANARTVVQVVRKTVEIIVGALGRDDIAVLVFERNGRLIATHDHEAEYPQTTQQFVKDRVHD